MVVSKKSQTTTFIIVGLVLLIVGITFFSLRSYVLNLNPIVPDEVKPINTFIELCIKDVSTKGLVKLGEQGGIIDLNRSGIYSLRDNPTHSNAVYFSSLVPYWWFLKSPNTCKDNCLFKQNYPFLTEKQGQFSIEKELDVYVEENLKFCLNDFNVFNKEGVKVTPRDKVSVNTEVRDKDVLVTVNYPLTIRKNNKDFNLDRYTQKIDLNIKKIYELSTQILASEQKFKFLEHSSLQMLSAKSGIDKTKLPPMSASSIGTKTVFWGVNNVKDDLTSMLESTVPLLRVEGSKNYKRIFSDDPVTQRIFDNMILPITGFSSLNVNFNYFSSWPIYLNVNDANGIIKPESAFTALPFPIGFVRYNTVYDYSYPVLVVIEDETALEGKGYRFMFALESNVRLNSALNTTSDIVSPLDFVGEDLFCDLNQRQTGNITITVLDKLTSRPVDGATVNFNAVSDCAIGETNIKGMISEPFPVALGELSIFHPGYVSYHGALETMLNQENSLTVFLNPVVSKNFTVKKYLISKSQITKDDSSIQYVWTEPVLNLRSLSEDEEAIVLLERIPSENDGEFVRAGFYNSTVSEIEVSPGEYYAELSLIKNSILKIPAKHVKKRYFIFGPSVEFDLEQLELEGYLTGGAVFDNGTGYLKITEDEFNSDKEIVFKVFMFDLDSIPEEYREYEDLSKVDELTSLSMSYRNNLEPIK